MTTKACPVEPLVSSDYCRLTVCPECGIINCTLPCRISFQFEIHQFIEITKVFNRGVQLLSSKSQHDNHNATVIEFNRKH